MTKTKGRAIIEMPRSAFQEAFQTASKAVSYKKGGGPQNNILIRTDTQEQQALFYGTNIETAIRHQAACETAETHAVAFDKQLLDDLLSASDGPTVTITWNGRHNYQFRCGGTTAEFKTEDPDNFPMPRVKHTPVLSFTGERFRVVARQLDVVNQGDQGGFRLYRAEDRQLWMESFDTTGGIARVRLGDYEVLDDGMALDWIMLNKSVRVAADVFGDKSETVKLASSKTDAGTVVLKGENTTVVVRLFAAHWPNLPPVFASEVPYWVEASRKDWVQGLQLMQLLSDSQFRGGKGVDFVRFWLDLRPDGATVRTFGSTQDSARALDTTALQVPEEMSYVLPSSYILSAINTLSKVNRVRVGLARHATKPDIVGCSVWSEEDARVEWRFPGFTVPGQGTKAEA